MTNRRLERTLRMTALAFAAAAWIGLPARARAEDDEARGRVTALGDEIDIALSRTSRRAALDQWWNTTPHYDAAVALTTVGGFPGSIKSDGADVWVSNISTGSVSRIRASDGRLLETWTANTASGVLVAMGRVFVTGATNPGALYMIDPSHTAGAAATVAEVGIIPLGIAFDGNRIWTSNFGGIPKVNTGASVSIITPGPTMPWKVTTVNAGFEQLSGILFDGTNIWVTDSSAGTLLKLDGDGAIVQTVPVGEGPENPAFDGSNIWVPNSGDDSLTVVRASDGAVLRTFSAANGNQNGLSSPEQAAFDGQRILVSNFNGGLSLFQATDLSVIGNFPTPGVVNPKGVCSDGVNFWVTFAGSGMVGRF